MNRLLTLFSSKRHLISVFLLCALPLGLFMVVATPLGNIPDEPAHMARAEGLLRGVILGERKTVTNPATAQSQVLTGFLVDAGMFGVSFPKTDWLDNRPVVTQSDYNAVRSEPVRHDLVFAHIPNTATYFPAAYIPGAIGLEIGVLAHASPFQCMMLARFGMLSAFLALGTLAIWLAAYGEALLIAVLLTPMALNLAGSMSQDGVLIAVTCVCAASLTNGPNCRFWVRAVGLVAMFVLLAAKPAYVPLLAFILLPLVRFGFWGRVAEMLFVSVPVAIWLVLIAVFVIVPFGTAPYHPGPLFTGDPNKIFTIWDAKANLRILLADPARFITLPLGTLEHWYDSFADQMIGALGAPGLWLDEPYYDAWKLAFCFAALGLVFVARPPAANGRVWVDCSFAWLLIIGSFWAIFIVAYLDWTNVGSAEVWGVQGRYFLILLPFVPLAIPRWRLKYQMPGIVPVLPVFLLGIFDLAYIPAKLLAFYYVH